MADSDAVAVIGIGRFGESLARELMSQGTEVLVIDSSEQTVQRLAGEVTHAVTADATDEQAMRQLGLDEFSRVAVGIGSNLEASILTCSTLRTLEVPSIWAKAISAAHARILTQLGVDHVIRPEHDTGRRIAHLVAGRLLDYIELDDGYAIAKMHPPRALLDTPLGETGIRRRHGVTVIGVKESGEAFHHASADTVVGAGSLIIVSGARRDVERFSELG
ncbi:TrkA family potassium uptake protein [Nocardioides lentus]|uniref:TrkA family potassium uptake protein n=1 Tax=Nocardioides lentus TaxID=338077 RepID=A0ABN2PRC9_9ACTN